MGTMEQPCDGSDTPLDLNSNEAYLTIRDRWLCEISELDSFNRAESMRVKSFMSSTKDRFRAH